MRSNGSSECSKRQADHPEAKDIQRDTGRGKGRLSIVSLGPGSRSYLVPEALDALMKADVIVGYKTYLELITDLTEGKIILSSGMRKEIERCRSAIDHALAGYRVALVSSGDAGIYGMAGLTLDLCRECRCRVGTVLDEPNNGSSEKASCVSPSSRAEEWDFVLEVIPGVAAFNASASLLGAPLMHDFASVSLSDHLTPWETIEKRLAAAASADFVLAVYNPRSKTRPHLLERAQQLLLQHRAPQTPVGIVRRAMRKGEWRCLTTLERIPFDEVDMQSLLLIGNSRTYIWNGWMITPRGYLDKYSVDEDLS